MEELARALVEIKALQRHARWTLRALRVLEAQLEALDQSPRAQIGEPDGKT